MSKHMTKDPKDTQTAEEIAAEAKAKEEKDQADAEFEESLADLSDEEKEAKRAEREASHNDKSPDYDAELKAERERREKAEAALAEKRFKASERKRKGEVEDEETPDDEDDDRPLTKRDLGSILESTRQATLRETQAERIDSIARELTANPKEAELIVEIHKNRTWPSSIPLKEQLEEAHAIANRKRLQSKNKELARAVASKDGVSKDVGGGYRDPLPGSTPKMSSQDEASYKRAGFGYDSAKKLWKKKLPTGKFLYKDARTKKTFVGP